MANFYRLNRYDRKGQIHELSINPEILSMTAIEVYSTLVHEQCHIWQQEKGKPSRNGYHNGQWANKMLSVGLVPSSTGTIGGKMTGQNMSDYPQENGVFLKALEEMPDSYKLPFVSIEGDYQRQIAALTAIGGETISIEVGHDDDAFQPKPKSSNKTKYSCPCGCNLWGKSTLSVICGYCGEPFEIVS